LVHHRDRPVGGIRNGTREAPHQQVGAEPVIAVPVGGVDVGQSLAEAFDPVADARHLLAGERHVDQHGVVVAEEQRGGQRRGHDRTAVGQPLGPVTPHAVVHQHLVVQRGHIRVPFRGRAIGRG
jgi:hypothetical protein